MLFRFVSSVALLSLLLSSPLVSIAQPAQKSPSPPASAATAPTVQPAGPIAGTAHERREDARLELERTKVELEEKKLKEQENSATLTIATIVVTGLIGFATVAYNLRNATKQAQLQAKLKAIDVVIAAAGPRSARERLTVVGKLLGDDLRLETSPEDLEAAGIGAGHDQNRKDLLKQLADNPQRQAEILDLWEVVFGHTNLGPNIRALREHIAGRQAPK